MFILRNLNAGDYRLLITFEGLHHISKKFTISAANKDIDFGTLYMHKLTDLLEVAVIQRPPVSIKKDTVEYTADLLPQNPMHSWKTRSKNCRAWKSMRAGTSPHREKDSPGPG